MNKGEELEALKRCPSVQRMRTRILRPDRETGETTGSEGTFKSYLQRLRRLLRKEGIGPEELLEGIEAGRIYPPDMLNEFFDEEGGMSPNSMKLYAAAVKKLLQVNLSREAKRGIDWGDLELPKIRTVETDRAPDKGVIKRALAASRNLQDRAVPLVAASSGMRVGTLGRLTVEDIDMGTFPDVGVVRVRPGKAKNRVGYITFITLEAKAVVEASLEQRRRAGEEIGPDSPLFGHSGGEFYFDPAVLSTRWARMLERAGLGERERRNRTYHFHTLRKFFRTRLEVARVSKSFRERLLGHGGEYLDASYFDPRFEELLGAYRSAIPELTIESGAVEGRMEALERELGRTKGALEVLKGHVIGKMKAELEGMGVDTSKTPHEIAVEMGLVEAKAAQKVIDEGELVEHLKDGWRFVAQLNNESRQIVIERVKV